MPVSLLLFPPRRLLRHSVCQTSACWIYVALLCPSVFFVSGGSSGTVLCFICCVEESYLIMNQKEKHRGVCSTRRCSKFPCGPGSAEEPQKIPHRPCSISPQWAPDRTTHRISSWASMGSVFLSACLAEIHTVINWNSYERHFLIVVLPSDLFEIRHF